MYSITAFYHFSAIPASALPELRNQLLVEGERLAICGLILVATEGINATIAGSKESLLQFKTYLQNINYFKEIEWKDSNATAKPFRRYVVDIRPELITLGRELPLPTRDGSHLSPTEWHRVLEQEGDSIVLLDVRNRYETAVGKFRGAIDPELDVFSKFPEYLDQAAIPKDKKVLMYCTGGIRCEKAALEMRSRGYAKVYQLDGGILRYLEELPNQQFEGECFVFDHRVAVDQALQPSQRYKLRPHCGDPADISIQCKKCSKGAVVCSRCLGTPSRHSCSKNCEYHLSCHRSAKVA